MNILEVKNIKFKYSEKELYNLASMRLFSGEHTALVGDNGTGKTTLLKLLGKEMTPDSGSIEWVNNIKIGYLDQYALIDHNLDVKTYIYDVFLPLFEKERKQLALYESLALVDPNEYDKILNWAHNLGEELEKENFHAISSKIGNVLNGLGLGTDILDMPIKHLSGGMRSKLILANLLLKDADCLLLDEPTNFLDSVHVKWLSNFLNNFNKSFIVISHNEEFLRSIAKTVFSLENKQINRYKGNYDFYLKEKDIRSDQHQKDYDAQNKLIKKTQDFIDKNITRASTTKRAQSRRKMLEKIVKIDKPVIKKKINFNFKTGRSLGVEVLKIKDLEIGYQEALVAPITQLIKKNEKVVITGKNGVGKTTLIKTLLNIIPKLNGTFKWAESHQILYFEQDMLDDETITAFELIHNDDPSLTKKEVYTILASFNISVELASRAIHTLSGGEKAKCKFALMRNHKSNILILDEPTNHLDYDTKESLKEGLINYTGSIILVSHEKEFYSDICDYEIELE